MEDDRRKENWGFVVKDMGMEGWKGRGTDGEVERRKKRKMNVGVTGVPSEDVYDNDMR